MAVVALGRIGVAQGVDLSVVGRLVGLVVVLVATAALAGHRELERIARGVADRVGAVAIGADRSLCIFLVQGFLAVHRTCVGFQLVGMAILAAGLGDAQAQLGVLRRAFGRHIEAVRVVAVVARGIGLGLVVRVGPCMEGLLVGLDVFGDQPEAWLALGRSILLRLLPQALVAACAIHLLQLLRGVFGVQVGFVGVVRDVGVAGDALHPGMHALAELVRGHAVQGARFSFAPGTSSLPFLPSWQVRQVALSSAWAVAAGRNRRGGRLSEPGKAQTGAEQPGETQEAAQAQREGLWMHGRIFQKKQGANFISHLESKAGMREKFRYQALTPGAQGIVRPPHDFTT